MIKNMKNIKFCDCLVIELTINGLLAGILTLLPNLDKSNLSRLFINL